MSDKKSIYQILNYIQVGLKAPKGQVNSFGRYNYRSCEDILEALKAPLREVDCSVILSDEISIVSDRVYVTATATLYAPGGQNVSTKAHAREPLNKKGMDESQITGAASSYARKYALNGLFAIDDTKDADATEFQITETDRQWLDAIKQDASVIDQITDAEYKKRIETLNKQRY